VQRDTGDWISVATGHVAATRRSTLREEPTVSDRGRLCFYIPQLYPVATGDIELAGGIEVQHWAVARALAGQGFDVTVATWDYGQASVVRRNEVELLRTYAEQSGIRGVRFFYPRLWSSLRTLRNAAADVYVASGASLLAGWTYDAAKSRRARFVFFAASDKDALPTLPALPRAIDRWWYRRALLGADARIAQTDVQRQLFREHFGVEAVVIPNPADVPANYADAGENKLVLWLSTYKASKRPEWFVELARRLPRWRFVMAGFRPSGEADSSWRKVIQGGEELPNLEVNGWVEHSRIGEYLREAALFVHTSPLEGFPNTLLEAWSYAVPSVSAVDPGGVVARHRIGRTAGSLDELVTAVAEMMSAPDERRALGARARDYVARHHGPDQTIEPLAALLDDVIAAGAPKARRT
jgi:glycosyltransferase involved in cell wall biosynthesis